MKICYVKNGDLKCGVASFAEAWIEKAEKCIICTGNKVASFAEAWIENIQVADLQVFRDLASFAEAWIEKYSRLGTVSAKVCRLLRGGVD